VAAIGHNNLNRLTVSDLREQPPPSNLITHYPQSNEPRAAPYLRLTREPIIRRIAEQRVELILRSLARFEQLRPFEHLDAARSTRRAPTRKWHRRQHAIANVDEPSALRDFDVDVVAKEIAFEMNGGHREFSARRGAGKR